MAGLLAGRTMVAHNAGFDYDFLAREFAAAGIVMPVERRLCTLALSRRIGPPTENHRLGTLAAHYGIAQRHWHDALDDTRVLTGLLRRSLEEAARLGIPLPFVECPPRRGGGFPVNVPKARCPYRSPGRWVRGGPLVQGMKIAITGETETSRVELVARAVGAGLNVMGSVSGHTSLLVTNDASSDTGKASRARAEGVPVVDEGMFLGLLADVRAGTPLEEQAVEVARVPAPRRPVAVGPLAGHRVLVLGGKHAEAVAVRARVVELGGAAMTNLTGRVTDVVLLADAEADGRIDRARRLGLPLHAPGWLDDPSAPAVAGPEVAVLARGQVMDLPTGDGTGRWTVAATWSQEASCEVDVVAFAVDADEQVACDEDFVFYGAPSNGSVSLSANGPADQSVTVELGALPGRVRRVVVAAAVDGTATFGDVGGVEIEVSAGEHVHAQAVLDGTTSERTLLLAELYRRAGLWRLRAVGQGFDHGLAELARTYGVDVTD